MKLIPERRQLIENLREEYIDAIERQDNKRKEYLERLIQ